MTEELKSQGSVPTASQSLARRTGDESTEHTSAYVSTTSSEVQQRQRLRGEGEKLKRTLIGRVSSDKMDKTIVVMVTRKKKHPIGKYVTHSTKIKAHDELNTCKMGDWVIIEECRPISKEKRWALQSVVTPTGGV